MIEASQLELLPHKENNKELEEEAIKEGENSNVDRKGKKMGVSFKNKGTDALIEPFKGGIKIKEPAEPNHNSLNNFQPYKFPNLSPLSVESEKEFISRFSPKLEEESETTKYVPFKFHMKAKDNK